MPNGAVRMDGMPCGPLCTDCWAFERLTVESFVHKFDHLDGSRNPHIPPLSMRRDDLRYGNSSGTWTNPCAEHNNVSLELRNVQCQEISPVSRRRRHAIILASAPNILHKEVTKCDLQL
jgi:hypothetical protein